jgi:pyridoxamine 5'-phosphate oxidase
MIHKNDFSENSIDPNPFVQFRTWYEEHLNCGFEIPDSVTLATSSAEGRVSARTVLLKEYNDMGFVFFTNYQSRKGIQLTSNPKAAMLFYWAESGRQVRIEGVTEKIPEKESESYFKTRPRESQLSALTSMQSSKIPDRRYLDELYDNYRNRYAGKPVDKPLLWGGYRLVPEWFEFWQNGEFRLHDRLTYSKRNDLWVIERLAP